MVDIHSEVRYALAGRWESDSGDWIAEFKDGRIVLTRHGSVVLEDTYKLLNPDANRHINNRQELELAHKELSSDGVAVGSVENQRFYMEGAEEGKVTMTIVLTGGGKETIELTKKQSAGEPIGTESITKTSTCAYVTAKLENNTLSITIAEEEFRACFGTAIQSPDFDKPYEVKGMKSVYKDMLAGNMGNAVNPYVFLLTKEGTVECVPVAEQIGEGEGFTNMGEMTGLSDIVSFKEGSVVSEEGWGYHTVFAVSSDGKEHDLSEVWYRMHSTPENIAPSAEEATSTLAAEPSVDKLIKAGMSMMAEDYVEYLYGESCTRVNLGTNHEENFVREFTYAVSFTGAIYLYDVISDSWNPVNGSAMLYAYGWKENSMFAVLTNPDAEEYKALREGAEEIITPVISQFGADTVLLVPMRTGVNFSIEHPPMAEYGEEVIKTIENAKRGQVYAVVVTMAEANADPEKNKMNLNIACTYSDEMYQNYDERWYGVKSGKGGEKGIEFFGVSNG